MLSQFILSHLEEILTEWESSTGTIIPESNNKIVLRDSAEEILKWIANDMETVQTASQQTEKSKGYGVRPEEDSAAESHANERLGLGFNQSQLVSEYRALRATVIRLWSARSSHMEQSNLDELIRFNEGIDQALSESTDRFTEEIGKSRELAVAVMAHDLRNPLYAIAGSAEMILSAEGLAKVTIDNFASTIVHSCMRMGKLIENLLDFTRTRFGQPLVVKRESMDLAPVCQQTIAEFVAAYPERTIRLDCGTDIDGALDSSRISQMLANLISNALQHGDETTPVIIEARGESQQIILSVHNDGAPIPQAIIRTLFDPFSRRARQDVDNSHLGLGLFVVREIVEAHSGKISVTSTAQDGTTFVVRLPRYKTDDKAT